MKKIVNFLKGASAKLSLATLSVGVSASTALAQGFEVGDVGAITPQELTIAEIITNVVNVVLWIAGILAVVYLIWGGITYVTAGGDAEKASKGRVAITNAIIGIIIIVIALAIYNAAIKIPETGETGL